MKIIKIMFYIFLISLNNFTTSFGEDFNSWKISFKEYALKQGISKETLDKTMSKVKFLPNVIKYDRYQPEFYEDTNTYIVKRTNQKKLWIKQCQKSNISLKLLNMTDINLNFMKIQKIMYTKDLLMKN